MNVNKKASNYGCNLKMTQEEKIRVHRSRRPKMVKLAKEFATELDKVCKKYNNKLNQNYTIILSSQDFTEGILFNTVYKVVLLDQYFPENNHSPINLQ